MPMAMTSLVKDELSRVTVVKPCCRKAEVSTLLRFAGGLHLAGGPDRGRGRARHRRGGPAAAQGHRRGVRPFLRADRARPRAACARATGTWSGCAKDGDSLARQTGLVDSHGRPVRGLPRQVVSGTTCDCEAAWRGAFLAHGSLTEPGRSMALEITCPGPEAALALVGRGPAAEDPRQGARGARGGPGGGQGR